MRRLILLALSTSLLSACAIGPDYRRDTPALPEAWHHDAPANASAAVSPDWWTRFDDPALNALIAAAADYNQDLRLAVARVEEARAQYGIQRADRLPGVGLQGGGTRQRLPGDMNATGQPQVQGSQLPPHFIHLSQQELLTDRRHLVLLPLDGRDDKQRRHLALLATGMVQGRVVDQSQVITQPDQFHGAVL